MLCALDLMMLISYSNTHHSAAAQANIRKIVDRFKSAAVRSATYVCPIVPTQKTRCRNCNEILYGELSQKFNNVIQNRIVTNILNT